MIPLVQFVTVCGKYNASLLARQTIVALATTASEATPAAMAMMRK